MAYISHRAVTGGGAYDVISGAEAGQRAPGTRQLNVCLVRWHAKNGTSPLRRIWLSAPSGKKSRRATFQSVCRIEYLDRVAE